MPKPSKALFNTATWLEPSARLLMRLLARLPLGLVHRLGAGIGWLLAWLPNRQRRNTLINISLCQPELTARAAVRQRNRCLREFGKTYLEIAHLWQRPSAEVLSLVRDTRGTEGLRRQPGRGLIVLSPHLGAWELAGLYLAAQGPTAIFYKPQKYLDDLILAARKRSGATLAPITARGIRVLVQALERGDYVGILPDQAPRADKGAVFAPLFGIPAYSMLLVNRLARKTGAPVVFLFAERLKGAGAGYRIHCQPAPEAVAAADDRVAAAALNQGIEDCIRVCPEQYLWPYRRFRERPAGLPKFYSGPLADRAALEQVARIREQLDQLQNWPQHSDGVVP
ncbi:lysophospholipid acyltransferase family protein [Rhabdochromatium marinum]|uniref:lysophospholipid acyltransferase family protein n=1 Tax=Rhabdochromatium marinum TaxID=48729 RepID=UPI00190763DC|nr:lipid A biosynthesis acyltransferase [Rhabdochromatium marinum]MBK1647405.1 lipid A biosynthesis acyltransferase [Rhabdochromatium marinum]